MKWRNGLLALIGIWFIISPWVFHYTNHTSALWSSIILGAIQLIASGWATFMQNSSGWKVWQTWVSLIMGIGFIIQPFVLSMDTKETWTSVILGAITILLNLWTMAGKDTELKINSKSTPGKHAHA
ncbi:SPW repeat protein [Alicyclobacillus tolerans]|uniref:SPW repeat-containing protein n=2 Tax=Alicyclobacillus tolerans TaxID=90970 RepID=A0A1M6NDF7_9BACL|nr:MULTISPECIES: SPW repeat protein [Alicyclobacillus]MDP9728341.1 peptidoglycan/LPS O-acetylase OafA/YrhL [Alicyclobacillus tengchongensis]QRF23858.1 SPW repeat protein [Alicyclobacillus sp. TC]SHJ93735.1 SPW repeat-containing protein [Alicyclobacillus montanus]